MLTKKKTALLALALISVFVVGIVAGFYLGSIIGTITVTEPITWTPTEFTMTLFAGEENPQDITVFNAANTAITVSVSVSVDSTDNIYATAPENIIVPALSSEVLTVTVGAYQNATPGTYTVTVDLNR